MSDEITISPKEQMHEPGAFETADKPSDDNLFLCTHKNHWVHRNHAYYPKSSNPSICKACAAERKEENRKRQEQERLKQETAVGQIPSTQNRGGTKRATLSLSRYALTALDVLAVGSSASEVAERAIMAYLEAQDADVIAFVGRMFGQAVAS